MKKKHVILNLLYKKNIMRKIHDSLLDGLVGSLTDEYRQTHWGKEPVSAVQATKPPPVLHAVINMLIANLLHHFVEDLIEEVVDTITENQELLDSTINT